MAIKAGVFYFMSSLLIISIFVLMIFQNQIKLVISKIVAESKITAVIFKYNINEIIEDNENENDKEKIINELEKIAIEMQISDFIIYTDNGELIYSSNNTKNIDESDTENVIKSIVSREFNNALFYHKFDRKEGLILFYLPFPASEFTENKTGVLRFSYKNANLSVHLLDLYRQSIIGTVLIMLLHLIFALIFFNIFLKPLNMLVSATKEIGQGNFEFRIPFAKNNEFGQLADAFNDMSIALKNLNDDAKSSNPLTGLPGNNIIMKELNNILDSNTKFAVIYSDLDNFKAFNDKYGFSRGDEIILYTVECFKKAKNQMNNSNIFIGHEGGDDFLIICKPEIVRDYATKVIDIFDKGIKDFYNQEDKDKAYIKSLDREGNLCKFPIISISLAILTNIYRSFSCYGEIAEVAAEIKKMAKSIDGSSFYEDKRHI